VLIADEHIFQYQSPPFLMLREEVNKENGSTDLLDYRPHFRRAIVRIYTRSATSQALPSLRRRPLWWLHEDIRRSRSPRSVRGWVVLCGFEGSLGLPGWRYHWWVPYQVKNIQIKQPHQFFSPVKSFRYRRTLGRMSLSCDYWSTYPRLYLSLNFSQSANVRAVFPDPTGLINVSRKQACKLTLPPNVNMNLVILTLRFRR
jgi:hypothetical protein